MYVWALTMRDTVGLLFLGGLSLMTSFLVSGQSGAPVPVNFLIRPSSGNTFSGFHKSNKNSGKQTLRLTTLPNATIIGHHSQNGTTSDGGDLDRSLPLNATSITLSPVPSIPSSSTTVSPMVTTEIDTFSEFLPVENGTLGDSDLIGGVEGSGSGEVEEVTTTTTTIHTSEPAIVVATATEPAVAATVSPSLEATIAPLDSHRTTLSIPISGHSPAPHTTRAPFGLYQVRESMNSALHGGGNPIEPDPTTTTSIPASHVGMSFASILKNLNESRLVLETTHHSTTVAHSTESQFPTPTPDATQSSFSSNQEQVDEHGVTSDIQDSSMATDSESLFPVPPSFTTDQAVTIMGTTVEPDFPTFSPEVSSTVPLMALDPNSVVPEITVPTQEEVVATTSTATHTNLPPQRESRILESGDDVPASPIKPPGAAASKVKLANVPASIHPTWPAYPAGPRRIPVTTEDPDLGTYAEPVATVPSTRATTRKFWWTAKPHTTKKHDVTTVAVKTTPQPTTLSTTTVEPTLPSMTPIDTTLMTVPANTTDHLVENSTWVLATSTEVPVHVVNSTGWKFPMLPGQRNSDQQELNVGSIGHEGLSPFTIPDSSLAKFIFSTLIPSVISETTAMTASQVTTTVEPPMPTHGSSESIFNVYTTGTQSTETLVTSTAPSSTVLITETSPNSATITSELISVDTTTTATVVNSTHPRPLLFWSDSSHTVETRKLFADDTDGLQLVATLNDQPQDTNLPNLTNQNISRGALDNLVTVVMKYVGEQDFVFNETEKKILAELIFWPVLHETQQQQHGEVNTSYSRGITRRDVVSGDGESNRGGVPWPILRFMANTPKLIDGVWLIAAYVTFKDDVPTIMPRSTLLTLFHDAELKLMTKMSMQLIRVYPGLPPIPFNITDLREPPKNDYHPLFERFSSLFIPLIVLAAICAFVAITAVVCIVKKSQRNEAENKEKIIRPLGIMGEENPISDEVIKQSERSRPTSSNATMPVGASANEMYETEGWQVPLDPAGFPLSRSPPKRGVKTEEEDTKL